MGEYLGSCQCGAVQFRIVNELERLSWQGEDRYVVNLGCVEGFDLFSLADLPVNDGASY